MWPPLLWFSFLVAVCLVGFCFCFPVGLLIVVTLLPFSFYFQFCLDRENIKYDFHIVKSVEACFVSNRIFYLWKSSMFMWNECVSFVLGWKVLYIWVKSIWCRTVFNATIPLLIFCVEDLSISDIDVFDPHYNCAAIKIILEVVQDFYFIFGSPSLGVYMSTVYGFRVHCSLQYYELTS